MQNKMVATQTNKIRKTHSTFLIQLFIIYNFAITVVCVRESTKPIFILCSKWGHFNRAKPILKVLLASLTFGTVEKGFRSFNSKNLGSVGQRVAKLLGIKLCAFTLFGLYGRRVCTRLRPKFENARGQIILKVWWPVTLQPFDLKTPNFQHLKI